MLKEERQQHILNLFYENGKVAVDELAELFQASKDTIRRDLTVLEEEGFVKRVYGGAIPDKHPALAIDARKNL